MRLGGQHHAVAVLPSGKKSATRRTGGWVVWIDAENLDPTGHRSPARPTRSKSLYRLRYFGPPFIRVTYYILYDTI
jgi:hypothetical protein